MPSLRTFVAALGNLEGVLEEHVLQKKTLEAHLSALSEQQLSPLEKAQSATMLAYLVYDSIWSNSHFLLSVLHDTYHRFWQCGFAPKAWTPANILFSMS